MVASKGPQAKIGSGREELRIPAMDHVLDQPAAEHAVRATREGWHKQSRQAQQYLTDGYGALSRYRWWNLVLPIHTCDHVSNT